MSTFPEPWTSSVSHWQATNRGRTSLWGHNEHAKLPTEADVVIVGAGTMGSSLSYFLTREDAYGAGKKVVCVEAKDCGSGASGRNGGHVGPKTYFKWHLLMQPYPMGIGCSEAEATEIMQSERDNLDLVTELVEKHQLDVDFWRGHLCETHHSKEQTEWSRACYKRWKEARSRLEMEPNPDTSFIDDPVEAARISRVKGVTSVHLRPGGSIHSHKICTAMMRLAIESKTSDFQFYSHAPVGGFPRRTDGGKWIVNTNRGEIVAGQVILCTNAYTRNFFPRDTPLHDFIRPVRGQCSLVVPPPTFSGVNSLKHTYNLQNDTYMVQTPGGGIVLGGGAPAVLAQGTVKLDDISGQIDDSGVMPAFTEYYAGWCSENFEGWGPEALGEGLATTWTGILSSVKDWLPLIGEVPGCEGISMCAGFAGHGMSRIFACARGYADTLKTGQWDDKLLPRLFELNQSRLDRMTKLEAEFKAKNGALAGHVTHADFDYSSVLSMKELGDALDIVKSEGGSTTRPVKVVA